MRPRPPIFNPKLNVIWPRTKAGAALWATRIFLATMKPNRVAHEQEGVPPNQRYTIRRPGGQPHLGPILLPEKTEGKAEGLGATKSWVPVGQLGPYGCVTGITSSPREEKVRLWRRVGCSGVYLGVS